MTSLNHQLLQQHSLANRLQSILLLGIMAGFLALIGGILWGSDGIYILLLSSILLFLFNPAARPGLIMRMYQATPLSLNQAPVLHSALKELCRRANLRHIPTLYYVPSNALNAFAVGSSNNAVIAITDGLLRSLSHRESIGVLAHEIGHIKNNDTWVMGIADLFSRMTSALSLFGQFLLLLNLPLILISDLNISWFVIALLILAPNLSALAQLGLSRTREYNADLNAAHLTDDPQGLASALLKIEHYSGSGFEHILMPGRRIPEPSLLRTHPPTKERVRRLMALNVPQQQIEQLRTLYDSPIESMQQNSLLPPRRHLNGLWY